MDSLTQAALGATVAVAVMSNTSGSRLKIALTGAVLGTLPDLDVVIDYGDAVSNMVLHRTESHALFYQSLFSPALAWLAALCCQQRRHYGRWLLATWLVLITHTLIDAMTIYGTQFGLPFTNTPFAVGSMFIIDPLYTLPLLLGLGWYLSGHQLGSKANNAMLGVSSAYLLWSVLAQWHVSTVVRSSLQQQQLQYQQLLVTPAPLNTLLWRIVVLTEHGYAEGFYSLLDDSEHITLNHIAVDESLKQRYAALKPVQQLAWFSRGFYSLQQQGERLLITDLRMGQEGSYAFQFVLDPKDKATPQQLPMRRDVAQALPWLWQRMQGKPLPPPHLVVNQ